MDRHHPQRGSTNCERRNGRDFSVLFRLAGSPICNSCRKVSRSRNALSCFFHRTLLPSRCCCYFGKRCNWPTVKKERNSLKLSSNSRFTVLSCLDETAHLMASLQQGCRFDLPPIRRSGGEPFRQSLPSISSGRWRDQHPIPGGPHDRVGGVWTVKMSKDTKLGQQ